MCSLFPCLHFYSWAHILFPHPVSLRNPFLRPSVVFSYLQPLPRQDYPFSLLCLFNRRFRRQSCAFLFYRLSVMLCFHPKLPFYSVGLSFSTRPPPSNKLSFFECFHSPDDRATEHLSCCSLFVVPAQLETLGRVIGTCWSQNFLPPLPYLASFFLGLI